MKLPVDSHRGRGERALLVCGLLTAPLWIATDLISALRWEGYSLLDQAVSELSAFGAPTRSLQIASGLVYALLLIAFAAGVWWSAGPRRNLRMAACTIAGWGLVNLPGALFSMQLRGKGGFAVDAAHLIQTAIVVVLILLTIAFASRAGGPWFRRYSIATILAVLVCGAWASTFSPAVAAGQPTPWLGLIERGSVYAPVVWVSACAVVLLRTRSTAPRA